MVTRDRRYLDIILARLDRCRQYRPKFGTGKAVALEDFEAMYGQDPFYSWFGLDKPVIYAAHKAAGGITSLYRQIGLGCEEVFRQVLRDELELSAEEVQWSYKLTTASGRTRTLALDGRVTYKHISALEQRARIKGWVQDLSSELEVAPKIAQALDGVVFEVRQGYKSRDSKRQNADLSNITSAYARGYLSVFIILSTQIDNTVATRYRNNKCPVLTGSLATSPFRSTYAFCEQIVGYDLAGFFTRNSEALSAEVSEVIKVLLGSDG
ncbi:MAG: hypothetical protein K8R89_03040 [Anaerolineae bacterium]|nr:hypothetical protein [Anaerolineae bacterium]